MARRQLLLLFLIVCTPLALLVWLGWYTARLDEQQVRQQFHELFTQQLRDLDTRVAEYFRVREIEFRDIVSMQSLKPRDIRERIRGEPQILQLFVLRPNGTLQHPDPNGPLNDSEQAFLLRASQVLVDRDLIRASRQPPQSDSPVAVSPGAPAAGPQPLPQSANQQQQQEPQPSPQTQQPQESPRQNVEPSAAQQASHPTQAGEAAPAARASQQVSVPQRQAAQGAAALDPSTDETAFGWYTWYWGRGLHLIFWHRRPSGHVVGVALDRVRWISDVISLLPDTSPIASGQLSQLPSRIRLVDSNGNTVYQWGSFEPTEDALATADIPLSRPLNAWRLQMYLSDQWWASVRPHSRYVSLASGVVVLAVSIGVLSVLFYRQYAREMREAMQRVNFVNQVSHELKTPLTNIRMYAELLERDLEEPHGEANSTAPDRLRVIVSESERLSRLIGNVLAFARQQRQQLHIRRTPAGIDQTVANCLERFRPSLAEKGLTLEFHGGAPQAVEVDVDALQQILANLLSNVEKYAAGGKSVTVTTRSKPGRTVIEVADRGPGIERAHAAEIFQPFYRISSRLEDAPGTGIGLAIARQLAQLHGGDLTLQPSEHGACFRVELATPSLGQQEIA